MARKKSPDDAFVKSIRLNCDISDARDHGIYSVCVLVLKLRVLYKWEKGLEPWVEPGPAEVLDWIDQREGYWAGIAENEFQPLELNGASFDPFDVEGVNGILFADGLYYGAGYGRSMKPVFFLAEILEQRTLDGNTVLILGTEKARELAGPFAMRQERNIIIRKQQLKYFLWDHLQEIRPSAKDVMLQALHKGNIIQQRCTADREGLKNHLARLVEQEIPIFVHHEIGEMQATPLSGGVFQRIVSDFPDSLIEFFSRAVKDVLADTHPQGMLRFIINERREMSLALYLSFMTGIGRTLFPEIVTVVRRFMVNGEGDWSDIERAREAGWANNLARAERIAQIVMGSPENGAVAREMERELLAPLGLGR